MDNIRLVVNDAIQNIARDFESLLPQIVNDECPICAEPIEYATAVVVFDYIEHGESADYKVLLRCPECGEYFIEYMKDV
jgi:uncharacterized protein with PIN domain